MRIIITDTGLIWNPKNPFLEQFADSVLVVCLDGKKATDKYECFVSPYKPVGLGYSGRGIDNLQLKVLASVAKKLNSKLNFHEDVVFLTDNEVSTLYPFYALKDLNEYNNLHLISISPFRFEGSKKIRSHYELISDLSSLDSFLLFNANEILEPGEKLTMREVYNKLENYFIKIMPTVLNGIHDLYNKAIPCYFDFSTMSYISLMNGFKDIDISKEVNLDDKINFQIYREFSTLGMIGLSNYPMESKYINETIERPASRPEGKLICNMLREQRLALAKENNIPFESPECPSQGPCAGTCAKCDTEAEYLRRQLKKIPKEKRVFPQFDPTDIVNEPDYPIKKPEDRPVMYGDLIDIFKK